MITDPYKVLGLEPGATDEQVKSAYKELVKKYHPDRYQNNPLEELAEEKLREINEAYDMIMKGNRSRDNSGYRQDARNIDPEYQKVRRSIDMGNLKQAQDLLDNIPNKHTAEWLFLSGMISYRRGWYDDAMGKIQQAVSIEPSNPDYRQALDNLMSAGMMYRNQAYGRGYSPNEAAMCQACQCALCADCCCNMCGGY